VIAVAFGFGAAFAFVVALLLCDSACPLSSTPLLFGQIVPILHDEPSSHEGTPWTAQAAAFAP
jgi:hypothetical protein